MLMLARIIGLFFQAPVFSSRSIPAPLKIAFMTWITISLWLVTDVPEQLPTTMMVFAIAVFNEFVIGFIIGHVGNLIIVGVQESGSIMDMQMGLSSASALDPASGVQTTIMNKIMYQLAILLFVVVDGHHAILGVFHKSFRIIPVSKIVTYDGFLDQIIHLAGLIFMNALLLALPIVVIIFLLDFSLGILNRVAPQVNVFFLGFQIKPILGLWVTFITVSFMGDRVKRIIETIIDQVLDVFLHISFV
jgi:flagellar biosynthetic protein FliR